MTLEKIEAERARLETRILKLEPELRQAQADLSDLAIAERVLNRLADAEAAPRRGRPRREISKLDKEPGNAAPPTAPTEGSLAEAVLKVVAAHELGATRESIANALAANGMKVRPNHLGISLTRHFRAGRLVERDGRWFHPDFAPPLQKADLPVNYGDAPTYIIGDTTRDIAASAASEPAPPAPLAADAAE